MRLKRGLSQKEVAQRLELHKNTISNYENNTITPSLEILVQLAVIYNSSIDYMVGMSDRSHIYIDDCTAEQQKMILDVVGAIKHNLKHE